VVVLAPGVVTDPAAWLSAVRQLVTAARLDPLRWVVLDCTQADPAPLTEGLERRFEQVDATPDPKAALQLLNGLIAGMKAAPAGCGAQRLSGMPGPADAPPRRKGQAPDNPSAALDKLSDNGLAGLADAPLMQHLRIVTLEAASAFADGDPSSGIRHQTDARDLCVEAGLLELASVFELSLGAHLLQAGAPEQSLTVFDQAAERARSAGAPQVVVQALMARAGALMLLQRPLDAAAAYASGGAFAAEHAGVPALLTIECWRMQGQIFMGLGRQDDATQALRRALAVATDAPTVERVGSSAPLAARDLAALYASHGLSAQSNALLEQAERWDAELPEVAPAPALGAESPS
jgi:tetratricopeptide (TPR) repeat protein